MRKIIFLALLIFSLTGCSLTGSRSNEKSVGGVFKSIDGGENWTNQSVIPTASGQAKSIANIETNNLIMDPSDNEALYLGSVQNGLFYTYDGAKNWNVAYSLGRMTINALAVDPNFKCSIYVSSTNKVYKSDDCSRSWRQIYYDNNPEILINTIAINHYSSSNIYIGTSRGEIIKSEDSGKSWQTINRFDAAIQKIIINPKDSRIILTATKYNRIYSSKNSGQSWVNLNKNLAGFKIGENFRDLIINKSASAIFLITDDTILKSHDYGLNWEKINLIPPEKDASVKAIAVSASNDKVIYYTTDTAFYRSIDGGINWATKKLPTSRSGWSLAINPQDDKIIYLGVKSNGQKSQATENSNVFGAPYSE